MFKFILFSCVVTTSFLSALTYEQTVSAYEEALENQCLAVYELKYQRKQEENRRMAAAYGWVENKEEEVQRMLKISNERLNIK